MTFDTATLELLHGTNEVRIRTSGNKRRPVTIWIVVVDDVAFVRSVRGPTAQWFIAASADGQAMLDAGHPGHGPRLDRGGQSRLLGKICDQSLRKVDGRPRDTFHNAAS
jgi:hypothetical protein